MNNFPADGPLPLTRWLVWNWGLVHTLSQVALRVHFHLRGIAASKLKGQSYLSTEKKYLLLPNENLKFIASYESQGPGP